MNPSSLQIRAAVQTLTAAGWTISGPASERCVLLSAARVAELLEVSPATARRIMQDIPGTVMLPGGDLRCRAVALERWLDQRCTPAAKAQFEEVPA
jgi:hypothetical protein